MGGNQYAAGVKGMVSDVPGQRGRQGAEHPGPVQAELTICRLQISNAIQRHPMNPLHPHPSYQYTQWPYKTTKH